MNVMAKTKTTSDLFMGKMGICPYFTNYAVKCSCSETI